jgi:hypothetical protein
LDRFHDGFTDVSSDTLATLDNAAFHDCLNKHKRNITKHGPVDTSEDEEEYVNIVTLEETTIICMAVVKAS